MHSTAGFVISAPQSVGVSHGESSALQVGAQMPHAFVLPPTHAVFMLHSMLFEHGCQGPPLSSFGPQSDGHTHTPGPPDKSQSCPGRHSMESTHVVKQTDCNGSHAGVNKPTSAGHVSHSIAMGMKLQSGEQKFPAAVGQHVVPGSHDQAGPHGPHAYPTSPHVPGPVSTNVVGSVTNDVDTGRGGVAGR